MLSNTTTPADSPSGQAITGITHRQRNRNETHTHVQPLGGMVVTLGCIPVPLGVMGAAFDHLEAALGSLGAHFAPP